MAAPQSSAGPANQASCAYLEQILPQLARRRRLLRATHPPAHPATSRPHAAPSSAREELTEYLLATRARQREKKKSSTGQSAKRVKQRDERLLLLEKACLSEDSFNETSALSRVGDAMRYGNILQLQHVKTGKYLAPNSYTKARGLSSGLAHRAPWTSPHGRGGETRERVHAPGRAHCATPVACRRDPCARWPTWQWSSRRTAPRLCGSRSGPSLEGSRRPRLPTVRTDSAMARSSLARLR